MVRLVSVNIEGDVHLELIAPFLARQGADIVCLQEVFRDDLQMFFGDASRVEFLPMSLKVNRQGGLADWGIAMATRLPVREAWNTYYYQPATELVPFDERAKRQTVGHGVVGMRLTVASTELTVVTTHFTWTPDGMPDTNQDTDIVALLNMLQPLEPHVLCGDFNIPREQNRHYRELAKRYTDHVPLNVLSSIHVPLHNARHRSGVSEKLGRLMVDYIFSTPDSYGINNVELHGGVSDHLALTATIERLASVKTGTRHIELD